MRRLRWTLLAAMIALVGVTLGVGAAFTRRATHAQVKRLLVASQPHDPATAVGPLEDHVRASGDWRGVEAVLDRMSARVILTTLQRDVIAVPAELRGATIAVDAADRVTATHAGDRKLTLKLPPAEVRDAGGRPVARAYLLPRERPVAERELASVDRGLIASLAVAMLVALALTVAMSRRITRPIEELTDAVQELGRGGSPTRVRARGRDEIARLAASFNAMADTVATQEELRRRMVGDVAHELRTPITNLRCDLEAIQDGLAQPDAERIASLRDEVLHLQRLVEDLQELAIADAGALRLDRQRVDLGATVARLVGDAAEVASQPGLVVEADVTRLRQVLGNLLANAAAQAPAGTRVKVSVARAGGDAVVSVADEGPGIPAGELERVFERFYRLDPARGRERGGAGLGLAIVRRLVELHDGRVWAESVEGRGATFSFTIPLASS
jgi:signal transduction histidine kinase